MELTIEKAKEIIDHQNKQLDNRTRMNTQTVRQEYSYISAGGFIEGWNQAIETIEKGFLSSTKPFDLNDLEKLKVKGEK